MLVLSRKTGESIRIGDEIIVRVTGVRGDLVRIGIEAPRDVPVHRDEVFQQLARQATRAAAAGNTQAQGGSTDAQATEVE